MGIQRVDFKVATEKSGLFVFSTYLSFVCIVDTYFHAAIICIVLNS